MKALAGLLAAVAAPAGANPAAIGEALALCIEVVEAESPAPLEAAGTPFLHDIAIPAPDRVAVFEAPAGIGFVTVFDAASLGGYDCALRLPYDNSSGAMRWEKLANGPVMALKGQGFTEAGGSPAAPKLARCTGETGPLFVTVEDDREAMAVSLTISNQAPVPGPCEE